MLIFDEVMAGFGRTGEWFAWQGIDGGVSRRTSTTFAKGVNSGYVPRRWCCDQRVDRERVRAAGLPPADSRTPGIPSPWRSIVASIDAMESEGIVENAKTIGEQHLGPRAR